MIRKPLCIIGTVAALTWSGAALAVYTETSTVTVTDQGKPVPGQTVVITQKETVPQTDAQKPKPKPRIKKVFRLKTGKNGKIIIPIDMQDNRPGIYYDVTLGDPRSPSSRTMRDIAIGDMVFGGGLDFTNVAPTAQTAYEVVSGSQPVRYMPSGWTIGVGVEFGVGESRNDYGNVPTFNGSGAGGGAFFAARYYTQSGWFFAADVGGMGLNVNGRNADGAFSKVQSMTYEEVQAGYRFSGTTNPINVYVGGGAAQAKYTVGVDSTLFNESMTRVLDGWTVHTGFEVQPAPMSVPNLWVGFDYRYSRFDGTIVDDRVSGRINFFAATVSYQIPVGR